MRQQCRNVQAGFPEDRAAMVLNRHDARACLRKQTGRDTAHVAKALYGHT